MTWVQCSACSKWRALAETEEEAQLDAWVCAMNSDARHNTCAAPEASDTHRGDAEGFGVLWRHLTALGGDGATLLVRSQRASNARIPAPPRVRVASAVGGPAG